MFVQNLIFTIESSIILTSGAFIQGWEFALLLKIALQKRTKGRIRYLQMKKNFICKGKHCLQTCKDDKKSFTIFAGNLGNILRGTVPKYKKSRRLDDTIGFEKLTRPVGQKTLFSVGLK